MKTIKGISASPGIAIGEIHFLNTKRHFSLNDKIVDNPIIEIEKFHEACKEAVANILVLKEKMSHQLTEDELSIYDAHISIIQDPELIENTATLIQSENITADHALFKAAKGFINLLEQVDDDYIKSRIKDIEEVTNEIIGILQGVNAIDEKLEKQVIIIAEKITTTHLSSIDKNMVLGIITAEGGATDHTAIISKAMGIPVIAGIKEQFIELSNASLAIIDAENNCIYVDPDEHTKSMFYSRIKNESKTRAINLANSKLPATTLSGKSIKIYANVGNTQEAILAESNGADGVGLLRSELCFLERNVLPTEQDHYNIYKEMLDALPGKEVVIRLLDIGSDKKVSYIEMPEEENPAMGLRALRLGFSQYANLLKPQLRALLKLSNEYNILILCPMIATPDDLIQIKEAIKQEMIILSAEGININKALKVGIMVEVPNVALLPELFVDDADFFSFGTNDLAQYIMAADRTNANVSNYLDKAIPGILKMVETVIKTAHHKGKWVGICGELASQKNLLETFINMGVDELSMTPSMIPEIKSLIRGLQ